MIQGYYFVNKVEHKMGRETEQVLTLIQKDTFQG
jgi:hypothetical protein